MPKGKIIIKNDDLGIIIGRVLEGENRKPGYEKKTEQEAVEDIIGTYAMDIFYSGLAVGKDLEFAYETLSDLPVAVASCYQRSRKDRPEELAVNATIRSLASYFFALSMNEHGLPWNVQHLPEQMRSGTMDVSTWCGLFRITTGKKHKADYLLPVLAGCQKSNLFGKKILSFDLAALFKEYKAVTGVDLEQHGLKSIAFDL